MSEINRVLRAAAIRLFAIDVLRTLAVTLTAVIVAILFARLAQQVWGFAAPWAAVFGGAAGAALVASLIWSALRRRREVALAREVDDRAGLREALSTALCVAKETDPWSKVVVTQAQEKAKSVQVSRVIPWEAPRMWPVPIAAAMTLAVVWFTVGPIDISGALAANKKKDEAEQKLAAVREDLTDKQKKIEDLMAKAKVEVKQDKESAEAGDDNKADKPLTPEELQKAAVKKLTNLTDALKEQRDGEKGDADRALRDALKQLKPPGEGNMADFQRALARGNFQQAQESLSEAAKQLQEGKLSPEQAEQMKKQLENMGKQLEKMAADNQQLAKKLEQAGMDGKKAQEIAKKMASNPEALKEALEAMKNMTPEQKQQLQEMAKAMQGACKQCEGMSESMAQMAKGMSQQGMSQEGSQGMQDMQGQLSQMEMTAGELASLEAAMDEAQAQLRELGQFLGYSECNGQCEGQGEGDSNDYKIGQWREGENRNQGVGSGGPGRGLGPSTADSPADYQNEKKKVNVKNAGGPIIGSSVVFGDQVRGESQATFSEAVSSAQQNASDAIATQQIPREMQDAVKKYFGRLDEKAKPKNGQPEAPKPPAAEAKDAGEKKN